MSDKQKTIIMLLLFFSALLNVLCFFNITIKNMLDVRDKYKYDYMGLYWYDKNPRFDYFNGVYLSFGVIMVFCFLCIHFDRMKEMEVKK